MNKSELIKVLMSLRASYGALFKYPSEPEDEELDRMTKETWFASLKPYYYKEVMAAIQVIKLEGDKYPPHDGMIARKILDNREGETMTADEAWERGADLSNSRHGLITKWEQGTSEAMKFRMLDKAVLKYEEEILRKTVNAFGGLNAIYDKADSYSRSNFVKTYNNFKESIRARTIKEVAGVEDPNEIEEKVSTEAITEGLKRIGRK